MGIFSNSKSKSSPKPLWYCAGLAFDCQQCGRCCSGPEEGYVWVSDEEIASISSKLGVTEDHFRRVYARKVGGHYTIREQKPTNDCLFLKRDESGQKRCEIYSLRPSQCRTWPFWPGNIADPDSWARAADRCPGVNRGELFSQEMIQERAAKTVK
jgi:Fe-S-cluster containining protein